MWIFNQLCCLYNAFIIWLNDNSHLPEELSFKYIHITTAIEYLLPLRTRYTEGVDIRKYSEEFADLGLVVLQVANHDRRTVNYFVVDVEDITEPYAEYVYANFLNWYRTQIETSELNDNLRVNYI